MDKMMSGIIKSHRKLLVAVHNLSDEELLEIFNSVCDYEALLPLLRDAIDDEMGLRAFAVDSDGTVYKEVYDE
jgi:hypothetical protein